MKAFLRALATGLVTAVVGATLAAFGADVATEARNVSDVEGGRGMFIAFILVPMGFLGGFVIGAIAAAVGPLTGRGAYLVRQSLAIVSVSLLIGAITVIACVTAEQPPLIDGFALDLEVELRLPEGEPVADIAGQELRASLYAPLGENHYLTLLPDAVVEREGRTVVPAVTSIDSKRADRVIHVDPPTSPTQTFDLALAANPTAADEAWTPWQRPARVEGASEVPAKTYEIRFRVLTVDR